MHTTDSISLTPTEYPTVDSIHNLCRGRCRDHLRRKHNLHSTPDQSNAPNHWLAHRIRSSSQNPNRSSNHLHNNAHHRSHPDLLHPQPTHPQHRSEYPTRRPHILCHHIIPPHPSHNHWTASTPQASIRQLWPWPLAHQSRHPAYSRYTNLLWRLLPRRHKLAPTTTNDAANLSSHA